MNQPDDGALILLGQARHHLEPFPQWPRFRIVVGALVLQGAKPLYQ